MNPNCDNALDDFMDELRCGCDQGCSRPRPPCQIGPRGATGPTGATGADGATDPTGATGSSLTVNSMNAVNESGGTVAVVLDGTAVPLPDNQILDTFTVDAANTTFTVPAAGTYLVSYRVSTTAALLMSSRIL